MKKQEKCQRCGRCCQQGGPALHRADLDLVQSGQLPLDSLVTMRRGELALHPLKSEPESVTEEFIKIQGQSASWSCRFYHPDQCTCAIYTWRPQACGVLECWAPDPLLAMTGQDLLARSDCLAEGSPLRAPIQEHEEQYPCPDLAALLALAQEGGIDQAQTSLLTSQANGDLSFRQQAIAQYGLSLGMELFCFGRPLFQLLEPLGFVTSWQGQRLSLHWSGREQEPV